jgi:hypothetical protein
MLPRFKLLAIGAIAAAACLGIGDLVTMRLNSNLQALISTCRARGEKAQASATTELERHFELDCDPESLAHSRALTGIQAQIASAHQRLLTWKHWPPLIAAGVFGVTAVPFVWYFLLHRIRELSEAIFQRR